MNETKKVLNNFFFFEIIAEPIPLLEQELKNVEQQIVTTQQHMEGIEALKKTYSSTKETEACKNREGKRKTYFDCSLMVFKKCLKVFIVFFHIFFLLVNLVIKQLSDSREKLSGFEEQKDKIQQALNV